MKKKLFNNWILKIVSLIFAFILWLAVINFTNPVDDKTFYNIKVNLTNTELVTNKDMVYEVLDGTSVVRNVKVTAPKSVVDDLVESDIVAEADFANLTINNTIEIAFSSNRSGVTEIIGSIEMVKLNIEEKKTKRLEVKVNTTEPKEGYVVGKRGLDQNWIEVSGPASVISKIDSAKVSVDITGAVSDVSTYADIELYDVDNNKVPLDSLTVKGKTVRVSIQIWQKKEVPLIYTVTGVPAEGYMETGEVVSDPATVVIAGSSASVSAINEISIPGEALDITGQSANVTAIIDVEDYLPDTVALVGDFNGKATVTVHIAKQEREILTIPGSKIKITGIPAGFKAELDDPEASYSVGIGGLAQNVALIKEDTLVGNIPIPEFMEELGMEELKAGLYTAEVVFQFDESITVIQPMKVNIIISKMEE